MFTYIDNFYSIWYGNLYEHLTTSNWIVYQVVNCFNLLVNPVTYIPWQFAIKIHMCNKMFLVFHAKSFKDVSYILLLIEVNCMVSSISCYLHA